MKKVSVRIASLLSKEDYAAWWTGENGSEGYATENVDKIREISEKCGGDGSVMIWEEGNAYVDVTDSEKFEKLVCEQLDNDFESSII